ncbi:MAG: glycosyltransferase family 2 protein [Nitrospirae bacterium]|nr:glycosyltransferase family 2 protein [Candidatus Manganitrophaceae bacterium]
MNDLSISIVIPTYNRAGLVPRAIASALAASGPDDEIIVVDDGSTDQTEEAIAPFIKKIRYLKLLNGGAGRARNIGIRESKKPLVAFLDSDDEWMPDKLQLQRGLMASRPDLLFCFSDFAVRYRSGEEHRRYLINWHQDLRSWNDILGSGIAFSSFSPLPSGRADFSVHMGDLFPSQMAALYVFTSTLLVRREAAGGALRFAEDIHIYEDWECYGRLAQAGLAAYLDCETTWNHGHEGPRLTDAHAFDSATARIKVLERVWGSDQAFLEKQGDRYREILATQRVIRAKELLCMGRTREAGTELQLVENAPLSCRLLASLPGPLVQSLLSMRQSFRAKPAG